MGITVIILYKDVNKWIKTSSVCVYQLYYLYTITSGAKYKQKT